MGDVINIAKLKKVNSLASTLNKHGLAANRMDAANLAREINGKQETDYLEGLKINEKQEWEVVHSSNGQKMILETKQKASSTDVLSRTQTEAILQKFCDMFGQEISNLNATIKGLEIKFSYLQEQLAQMESKTAVNVEAQQPVVQEMHPSHPIERAQTTLNPVQEVREPENKPHHQVRSAEEGNNPRTGGYESNDVSIDKFFYFGTKN
ncbi:hypothetical protein HN695_04775 [Candidatus Woesearchaeota archaeon]|jgi:hypothetical protein|nr:hypothetical protein [Candidatus Woesearchaeota archaeon]MBT5272037.1 hypothetical protein [Candidatus Woesearchaeota archaeon]MBT6040778.1 hypothetical protein [Candidatus Woesearchaeota archaeon]MBT6336838.1 hypothetical protein [Candidatus Woesearchaeota archaeon]MBT7927627.1 hypothetical protein [Candidatus Woesearchaeota archaeon]